ncbi:hypothetical protein Scep_001909 [Stephania cephalantha]|uniref:Uncharacterized protein n=1 Tax=Stephania cephalantha TaxID=152367 RepID=A0AAP0Q4G9_9MAGN
MNVDYRTIPQNDLAKFVLSEGGWSKLLCTGEKVRRLVDVALVFVGKELQSSNYFGNEHEDPTLLHLIKPSCYCGKVIRERTEVPDHIISVLQAYNGQNCASIGISSPRRNDEDGYYPSPTSWPWLAKTAIGTVELSQSIIQAKLQRRRQELTHTTPDQPVDDEAVYYKVAGDCPKGCVYSLSNGSETELLYSVSDPLLIRDGSEKEYNNFVSDPLLIRDGSETESNNSVSDPLLIRDGLETEYNNSISDPLLIRDGSETESNNSISDPLLIRDGSETEYNNSVSDPLLIRDGMQLQLYPLEEFPFLFRLCSFLNFISNPSLISNGNTFPLLIESATMILETE